MRPRPHSPPLLAVAGAELLARVLAEMEAGTLPEGRVQDEEAATYCGTIRKEDGLTRWEEPADVIERKIRAFDPWPRMSTTYRGESLLLLKSHVYPDTLGGESVRPGWPGEPGTVLTADKEPWAPCPDRGWHPCRGAPPTSVQEADGLAVFRERSPRRRGEPPGDRSRGRMRDFVI